MRFTYFNFEGLVLGCIDTYEGVQTRIFSRFIHCTRRKQTKHATSRKIASFPRAEKCRRAAAFAASTESLPYESSREGANQAVLAGLNPRLRTSRSLLDRNQFNPK